MDKPNNNFDPDDIRNRNYQCRNMPAMFYYKAVYDPDKDRYIIKPFMRINNGDDVKSDFMEVSVKEKHTIQYKSSWIKFKAENDIDRVDYTTAEMLNIMSFKNKYEYNKAIIMLPPDNPDYKRLVSDFSIQLTEQDMITLRQVGGYIQKSSEESETPQGQTNQEKILKAIEYVLNRIEILDSRLNNIENNQKAE